MPGVHLYDIDDLQAAADANLEARRLEVAAVEAIIADEVGRFQAWLRARRSTPTIAALRQRAEADRGRRRWSVHLRASPSSRRDRQPHRSDEKSLVNRLLHEPVTKLRETATNATSRRCRSSSGWTSRFLSEEASRGLLAAM